MVTCFFVRLFFYQCWPDGPLGTNVDFDFHRLSFYLQNECLCQTLVSHENHLIFMRMTVQVTYTFIPIVSLKDSFCQSGKSKLGIGLFIHELLREPLILVRSQPLDDCGRSSQRSISSKIMAVRTIEIGSGAVDRRK